MEVHGGKQRKTGVGRVKIGFIQWRIQQVGERLMGRAVVGPFQKPSRPAYIPRGRKCVQQGYLITEHFSFVFDILVSNFECTIICVILDLVSATERVEAV